MRTIRRATGQHGSQVTFTQFRCAGRDYYTVDILNGQTELAVSSFWGSVELDAPKDQRKRVEDEGMDAFKYACEFIGLTAPED